MEFQIRLKFLSTGHKKDRLSLFLLDSVRVKSILGQVNK